MVLKLQTQKLNQSQKLKTKPKNHFSLNLCFPQKKCEEYFIVFSVEVEQTTCSAETARLGPNQTVLGFTFYGGEGSNNTYDIYHRDYFGGIEVISKYIELT